MLNGRVRIVLSLVEQCQWYIVKHIEKYPISTLSLLPLSTRERLLQWLSIADICQLEDTTFVKGIDMADIWNFIPLEDYIDDEVNEMQTMEYLVHEMGRAQFHKAILYGTVIGGYFGLAQGCHVGRSFLLPRETIKFLYGIRNFTVTDVNIYTTQTYHNSLSFPPRYRDKADIHRTEDIIDATISCFRGELPKILVNLLNCCTEYKYNIIYLLRDLRYLSIIGVRAKEWVCESLTFAHDVVKQATHLEVLSLHGRSYPHGCFESDPLSLDYLCSELSHHPTYWSNMRILEILECCPDYTVSQEIFDQLISAYLSAPTNCAQRVTLVGVSVLSEHEHQSLSFDHNYLQFKTIKLVDCKFILKHRAIPFKTILASWIGQEITLLEEDDTYVDAVSFQVVKSSSHLPAN